jgi:hypothetical protein
MHSLIKHKKALFYTQLSTTALCKGGRAMVFNIIIFQQYFSYILRSVLLTE